MDFLCIFCIRCTTVFSILRTDETHKTSGRLLPATQQVKQVPGRCHYDYRLLGVVGIADTSIFQPSLERKLWKLGFYDSFMV